MRRRGRICAVQVLYQLDVARQLTDMQAANESFQKYYESFDTYEEPSDDDDKEFALLDLSQIESGAFAFHFETLHMPAILEHVFACMRERAGKKNILISGNISPDMPALSLDKRAIERILTNLIDNAIKYCPPESRIVVSASHTPTCSLLEVSDTGPGIDEKHLARLFERFYRIDSGRSRDVGGTGLGLAIVKHLVESMGGTIRVKSAPLQGTTFTCEFPK